MFTWKYHICFPNFDTLHPIKLSRPLCISKHNMIGYVQLRCCNALLDHLMKIILWGSVWFCVRTLKDNLMCFIL